MARRNSRRPDDTSSISKPLMPAIFDSLERRMMLSTINWTNKGSATSDTDGFNANYGANAAVARQNVQRAIDDWATAIVNFNYSGGGNTFNVRISAAPIGGRGVTSGITHVGGKPNSANIVLDDDGGGGGWFFDSVIGTAQIPDDGEFRTPISLYTADNPNSGNDLYRTAVHELAHAMGISRTSGLLINNFLTNAADDPNSSDPADRLFSFNVGGGAVEATFTSEGGLHSYEGPSVSGLPIHPNDLINSGRTVPTGLNRRQLISDFLLTTLQQAYGYTILPVSQLNSFSTNLNTTTNLVTINGDLNPNGSDGDLISLTPVGAATRFFVNGRFETFSNSEFIAVQINAGNAGDTVNIDALPASGPATVSGGAGDDVIVFAGSSSNLDNVAASVSLDAGAGTDIVLFEDDGSTNAFAYTISRGGGSGMSFSRPNSGVVTLLGTETHTINGAGGANLFDVNGTQPATTWTLNGFNGNDIFNIGVPGGNAELVDGAITINGMVGTDTFNYHDTTATGNPSYSLSPTQLTRSGNGTVTYATVEAVNVNAAAANTVTFDDQSDTSSDDFTVSATQIVKTAGAVTKAVISYAGASTVALLAGQGSNDIFVNSVPAGVQMSINAGGGGFNAVRLGNGNVGANLLGPVTINAGTSGASNGVVFDNSQDTSPSAQTLNGGAFTDGQTYTVTSASSIAILNGGGGGTLDVARVTIPTLINALGSSVTVGAGNLDANLLAGVTVDSASSVTVDDRLDSGNDGYFIDTPLSPGAGPTFRKHSPTAPAISMSLGSAILHCNGGDNVITVNNASAGVQVFGNGGNDRFDVLSTNPFFSFNTIDIDSGPENAAVSPFGDTVNITGNSRVRLLNNDTIRSLSVSGGNAKFIIPTGVVARVLGISLTGVIDMAGGALLSPVGGPSQATLRTLLSRGYNAGAWNGTNAAGAINSSLAAASPLGDGVGYGLGSEIAVTSIGAFSINPGDALLRYTLDGDADLNAAVNISDFARLGTHFNGTAKVWTTGDFNYDNATNISDFSALAANFNQTLTMPRTRATSMDTSLFGRSTIREFDEQPIHFILDDGVPLQRP